MPRKSVLGQLSNADIRLLRVFKAVADCGGFAAAELELNIGRSTISRHIKDLEIRLGIKLCRRGRGGFALTDEGKRIYQSMLTLLAALDQFRMDVDDVHQRMTGKLVLAMFDKIVTNPASRVGDAIRAFAELAPDVELEVFVEPINEIEKGILDGRYHIGVVPQYRRSSSLDHHLLFDERMFLYCGRQHRLYSLDERDIAPRDVEISPFAGLGYHSPNLDVSNQMGLRRAATAYDQEAVALLIKSGRYIGFLPNHYAESFASRKEMRPIVQDSYYYDCQFYAVVRHGASTSRMVSVFLSELVNAHAAAGA